MFGTWSRGLETVAVGFWVAGRYSGPTHCEGGVSKPLAMVAIDDRYCGRMATSYSSQPSSRFSGSIRTLVQENTVVS